MHARDILELAALVAGHASALVEGPNVLPTAAVGQYWSASRCRLDRWGRALKQLSPACPRPPCGLFEEILVSDVLTRVWTAILVSYDVRQGMEEAGPPARSIFSGHCEARGRVMELLLKGRGLYSDQAAALNRVRRRAEKWTDVLLARLGAVGDLGEFAHDAELVEVLAADLRAGRGFGAGERSWAGCLASLRLAFSHLSPASLPNADLAAKIASSVLASFGAGLFDAHGLPAALRSVRLLSAALDAQGLILELFADETAPPAGGGFIVRRGPSD